MANPKDVRSVLKLGNAITTKNSRQNSVNKAKSDPATQKLFEEQYGRQDFDFSLLAQLPPLSLGREFYNYIVKQNLDPHFYKFKAPQQDSSEYAYLAYRLRKTHDLWHLLTGFETSDEGEAGLISFYYAQLQSPLSGLIIALSFIHFLLRKPKELPLLLNEVSRGWSLGLQAQPLLAVRWEDLWNENLEKLKTELQVNSVTTKTLQP